MLDADLPRRAAAISASGVAGLLFLSPLQVCLYLVCYFLADIALGVAMTRLVQKPHSLLHVRMVQFAGFAAMSAFLIPVAMLWHLPGSTPKIGALIHVFGGMLSIMLVRTAYMPLTIANSLPLAGIAIVIGVIEYDQISLREGAFLGFAVVVIALYFAVTVASAQRINRELAQARDTALARAETQRRFLATMSHELRTPLNGILGIAQSMVASHPGMGAQTIHDSARDMAAMVDDLLDSAAIEAGALRINRKPAELAAIMDRVKDRWQAPFAAKGLTLDLSLADDLPKAAMIDPLRLLQCLSNLLANALRLTHSGGASLALIHHPLGLEAVITDTGPGLPLGADTRLFRPFEVMQSTRDDAGPSTGLGLSITCGLARAMGGDLVVERPLAGGSRFRLTLTAPHAVPNSASEVPIVKGPVCHPAVLQGKRLLLVDDIATNRLILRLLLSGLGIKTVEASSGAEALAMLADPELPPPDAVLMDIRMPGLSGFDALARMREMGWSLPAIAVSADAAADERADALAHGFDGYLTKPVIEADLRCLLQEVLSRPRDLSPAQ